MTIRICAFVHVQYIYNTMYLVHVQYIYVDDVTCTCTRYTVLCTSICNTVSCACTTQCGVNLHAQRLVVSEIGNSIKLYKPNAYAGTNRPIRSAYACVSRFYSFSHVHTLCKDFSSQYRSAQIHIHIHIKYPK